MSLLFISPFWKGSHDQLLERESLFSQIIPGSYSVSITDTLFHVPGTAEKDLESAKLVQILHRLLADERSAPEIKYNSMVLICALMGSGMCFLLSLDIHQHMVDIKYKVITNGGFWFKDALEISSWKIEN